MNIDYALLPRHSILCLDMKSFFASVEAVERGMDPLQDLLVVVADIERPGSVVLSASPRMKEIYGIKTGSRLFQVPRADRRICIAETRMSLYLNRSLQITRWLNRFVPLEAVEVYSIDEAWICTDGTEKLWGDRRQAAIRIREGLWQEFGLPACIGIGPNKFLAKVILDIAGKKEGIAECDYGQVPARLWPCAVEDIWGIGRRLQRHLNRMGIYRLGDLAAAPLDTLKKKFGIMGEQLYWHSWGIDLSPLVPGGAAAPEKPKHINSGITLMSDYGPGEAEVVILELSEEVGRRLRRACLLCRTVALGAGYSRNTPGGFYRSRTMPAPTCLSRIIFEHCRELFRTYYSGEAVRTLQVSLSNLQPWDPRQPVLFADPREQKEIQLALTLDRIKDRYGAAAVLNAISLTPQGVGRTRAGKIGGHKK